MTKRRTAQTFNGSATYRFCKNPPFVGQLRLKTWAYVIAPKGANDPEWIKRAADYWQLQSETYGLRFDDRVDIMVDYGSGCVTTAVHVAEVLPGRRLTNYRTPRVAEKELLDRMVRSDEELLQ